MFKKNWNFHPEGEIEMSTNGWLTQKEQELVAVGASIAAGCRPCTAYHVRAARAAGAEEGEIRQAVNDALDVRRSATEVMARLAAKHLGDAPGPEAAGCPEKSLMGELVSIGAALAINCVVGLETHLAVAWQRGATVHQIRAVLETARAVKNMAGKKVEEAIVKAAKESEACADDCDCHGGTNHSRPASVACCGSQTENVATA